MTHSLEAALRSLFAVRPAPAELREGLLAVARSRDRVRGARRLRRLLQAGLAAALILVLGGGGAWVKARTRMGSVAVAQATLADFMGTHDLAFVGTPPQTGAGDPCACWSRGRVGFEANLPRSCPHLEVSGGRECRVKGMLAACYLLRDGRSLYVFPGPIRGAGSVQGQPLAVAASYQAKAWNEDGRGYVLVMPR
jgi:hypothetical protein